MSREEFLAEITDWELQAEAKRRGYRIFKAKRIELLSCVCGRKEPRECPMSTNAAAELDAYPKYKANYLRAFDRMLKSRNEAGLTNDDWDSAQDVMDWWLGKSKIERPIDGQIDLWEE